MGAADGAAAAADGEIETPGAEVLVGVVSAELVGGAPAASFAAPPAVDFVPVVLGLGGPPSAGTR